jgi:NhaA family Na+:H+ antiporter
VLRVNGRAAFDEWIEPMIEPLRRIPGWLQQPEKASGLLTVVAMLAAFAMVNSPLQPIYQLVHHTPVSVRVGALMVEKPLILWINEGLMVFFFLLIALEIKREVLEGHLASPTKFSFPLLAALGGMLAPASIYLLFTWGDAAAVRGWAIPTATDTVLALAALNVLGTRVPAAARTFLLALAIFDDLGAIVVLATLYTKSLSIPALTVAGVLLLVLAALNRFKVLRASAYVAAGLALWLAVLESGVHATLAGFLIGLAIPLRTDGQKPSPLRAAEKGLRPWVALGIVPVFAFFNSGITLFDSAGEPLLSTVVIGTTLALLIGKPVGVLAIGLLSVRLKIAHLPQGARWSQIAGASMLAGIGFTMSLFFAGVAFGTNDALALSAKIGTLAGSLASAVMGLAFLVLATWRDPEHREHQEPA